MLTKKLHYSLFFISLLFTSILYAQTSVTFNYTGGIQNWVVPPCVTSINVTAAGADGGGSGGGNGAIVTGTLAVTPGQTLQITVGGSGNCPGGGYGGGGTGANASSGPDGGCGGGGATTINVSPFTLASRVLVAGGGGGMGGGTTNVAGGTGGCAAGVAGNSPFGVGGGGGSQTAGGVAGAPWISSGNPGTAGSAGVGGNGGTDPCYNIAPGGGGGGGYYGGGGGGSDCWDLAPYGGGSGGGGSSLVPAGGGCNPGTNNGAGYVTITYTLAAPTAFAGPDVIRCFGGGAVTIGADPVCTVEGTPFSWSSGAGSGTIDLSGGGQNHGQASVSPAVTTTYTLTVGSAGCLSTDQVTVVVDMPPTASNPAPISVACTSNIPAPNVAVVTTEADDITIPPTVTWISDVSNGGTCPNIVTRTYRVTDACGNFVNVTQTITAGATSTVVMPANGSSTVACPSATNTAPTPPTVMDQCGRTLAVSAPVISAIPTCSGTRTYSYTYTNCLGGTYPWVYTYTVSAPTVTMPANGSSTVACPAATSTAPTVPTVLDNCGRTLTVSAPVISALPTCSGTRTYTYTFTSCSGTSYPWVYTYTVSPPTVTMPANGSSTVACPSATSTAPTAPTVLDNCGRTLTVSAPVISAIPTCSGTRTYTYTYTSCSGTTYPWVYTYTVSPPTVTMPADGGSTVACPSATSTAPTVPTVLDNCGRTLTVSAPVISAIPTCSGTRTYTYTFTSCSGTTYPWVYTFTVSAPTVTMPANGSSTVACPSAAIAPTTPTVLDNCGRTLTVSAPVISAAPTCSGTQTYTYTYTSCSGTTYPWVYTYTISAPTVTMPANGSSTVACPSAVTAPTAPTVLDNCGRTLTVSAPVISAAPTCSGTQTYTYTYTSCSGTTYPWVYTYTISAPTVVMPANGASTVTCITAMTAPTAPTVLDNCGRTLTVSAPVVSPDPACGGTKTYTYTYTSCSGTTYSWVYTYTYNDNVAPTASNPAPISVAGGVAPAPDPLVVIDEADNCSTPTVVWLSDVSDNGTCPEIITRTYRVSDACGNQVLVTQLITIGDAILPTASNPAPIAVDCIANVPAQNPAVVIDEADNGSTPTVSWEDDTSNGLTCPQTITRRYRVTDDCGNFIFVSQTITVDDNIAPVFTAPPANITVACIADVPAMTNLNWTDNCAGTGTVLGTDGALVGGTCGGTITRTWTYTDPCGNPATVTQTITVDDNIAPVFAAAPAAVTVACAADVPAMTNLSYTDNCDAAGSVTGTDVSNGGTCPEIITRTWTYTDACGNTSSTTQTITVHDLVAPVFAAAPAAVTVECLADVPAMTDLAYTDNCDAAGTVAGTDGALVGGACGGTITRTWTITDACGNTTTTTQTITVDDNTNPTASNPATTTVPGGPAPAVDPLVVIDEADNCTAVPVVAFVSESTDGAACPETITRIYSVTDDCGNTINVTHTILITDPFPPTASNPAPVAVECIGDVPAPDITVVTDEADNQGVPTVAFVSDASNGMTCPEIITRTYSVTDLCGGQIFVTQTITVEDITAPVFAAAPAAVTVACAADVPAMTNLGYTDNCDPAGTVAGTDVSNGGTCPEIITRTWTYTDACGNTSSTSQTITVHDLVAPVFAAAPAAVTVACAADVPAMTNLSYTDNCDAAGSVTGTDVSNGGTCPEIITRTWTITDACGNTSSTTQTITVHDLVAPVFAAAPAAVTVECLADVPAMTDLAYTDNCDAAGTVAGTDGALVGGACGGTITRTWTITDACGNTTTTTQTITVDDNTNPTASNPATTTVPGGPAPAVDPLVVIDEADNCTAAPIVAFVSESTDGGFCPETITRIYSVTDDCGNTINVTHTILITDPFPPTASNPAPVAVECIGDVPAPDVTVVTDEADNQGVPTVAFVSDASNGMTCPEIITRTYSVTDVCNNMITVTQTITVNDITAPTATAPATVNVQCIGDVPAPNTALITDEADNCTTAPVVAFVGDVSDGLTCPETITRTYSITDDCGNVSTVVQTIIVNDTIAPTASNLPSLLVECITDLPIANISDVTTEADNCTVNPIVTFVSDVSDGNSCPEKITRTYSVADDCGNAINVTQIITVFDQTPPTASNPAQIFVVSAAAVPAPDVTAVIDEADNCTVNPTVVWVSDVSDGNVCNNETITRVFRITDDCGNQISVTQLITITAFIPEINAGTDQSICEGESVTLTAFNPDNAVITWNQNVSDGQAFSPAVGTVTYTVIGDIYGCTASDNVTIVVNTNPNVNFASDVVQGCEPLAVTLTNSSTSDSPLISCEWDMGDGTILNGCGSVDYIYQNPGLYDVTLTTTNSMGCTSSETFNNYIYVEGYAVANFSASEYSVSNLTVETEIEFTNQSLNASGYIWSFGDSTSSTVENPSHIFDTEQAGSYEIILIATSPLGCNDTISHTITVTEELIYYIPNTFTPDGSMFNNVFQPVFTSGFDPYNFSMQIYNRWGELIFESFDATQGWDGTYLGKMMQSGTYTWKVEFKSRVNDKMYTDTGHVNLLR